jgi:hypothetical protein
MGKRPHTIAIIGCVFVAVGAVGLVRGLWPLMGAAAPRSGVDANSEPLRDGIYVSASGLVAAVGGVFALRGRNWARWVLVVWMAFHIALSLFHSASEFVMHCVLFAIIIWFLFRPASSAYIRSAPRPIN